WSRSPQTDQLPALAPNSSLPPLRATVPWPLEAVRLGGYSFGSALAAFVARDGRMRFVYAAILGFVGFVTSFGAHIVAVNLPVYARLVGGGGCGLPGVTLPAERERESWAV